MKTKIYVRIGQNKNGRISVTAGSRPSYDSLKGPPNIGNRHGRVIPTLAFALELEFPDGLLKQAEQVAAKINLEKKAAIVCGTIVVP